MTCDLAALCVDALDPDRLIQFWAGVLRREPAFDRLGDPTLLPSNETEFPITFRPTRGRKVGANQMHFDLTSSSLEDQARTVARAVRLGARHLDVGQGPEAEHVVLADPEGNEFCVIEPGNRFLGGCGFIGALASDGSHAVGHFWSEALGWPLVWDQDEETAIQSPRGGTKVTWGGPPLPAKTGKYRLHFDLVPADPTARSAEVARLLTLGASRADVGQHDVPWDVLVDPDGHEFCVVA